MHGDLILGALGGDDIIGVIAVALIFGGIPLTTIWTAHQRRMLELKLRLQNKGDQNVQASVDALREEVHALRETSMQYDLSFDAALQRMESRVENLERRANETQSQNTAEVRSTR